jgi:hypothetical protein
MIGRHINESQSQEFSASPDDYTYCRDSVVPTQMYGGLREYTRVYIASLHFAAYTRSPPLGLCRPCLSSLPRPQVQQPGLAQAAMPLLF